MDMKGNIKNFPDPLTAQAAGFDTHLKKEEADELLKLTPQERHVALRKMRFEQFKALPRQEQEQKRLSKNRRKAQRRARRKNRR